MQPRGIYHQYPLGEESQLYTFFIMPFGSFKYLQAPYGLFSIVEHYYRRMAKTFKGITGFCRIVNDIVIFEKNA